MKTYHTMKKRMGSWRTALTMGLVISLSLTACKGDKEKELEQEISKTREQLVKLKTSLSSLEEELEAYHSEDEVYKIPVRVKTLETKEFNHYISVFAEVEALQEALISPETNGRIERILIQEGDLVKQGQTLITLNTDVIEASIREAKTSISLLKTLYEKQKTLYEQEIGSEVQYLQAKNQYESAQDRLSSLKAQLDRSIIQAPFSGIVENIQVKEGEMASMGRALMHLVDLSNIKIKASISERYISQIKEGDKVIVSFSALDHPPIETPIRRISSTIDSKTRTFIIELQIPNKKGTIKPNLIASIQINDYSTNDALVIPAITIKDDFNGKFVFVTQNDSLVKAEKRYIQTGHSYQGETVVTEGLKARDQVIVEGFNMVSSGSLVEIKE